MSEVVKYEVAWFVIYSDEQTAKVNFEIFDEFSDSLRFYIDRRNEIDTSSKIISPEFYFTTLTRIKTMSFIDEDGKSDVREHSSVIKHDGNIYIVSFY